MQDKRLCFVINTLKEGGAAKMIKEVATLMCDYYSDVFIVSLFDKTSDNCLDKRIHYINLSIQVGGGLSWRFVLVKRLHKTFKQIQPDAVCSFVSDVCFYSMMASVGLNTKVLSAERGDPYTNKGIWGLLTQWVYKRSDYCFFQLERARDFYGKKVARKSFVIPNVFTEAEKSNPYHGIRKKTIVSVGRLYDYQKCYSLLIKAFSMVRECHPEYSLIIYGEGNDRVKLQALIEKTGLADCAFLPGAIKNPTQVIRKDGIFVLSSLFEGIPNSLIEALSTGIPCVTTDCSPGGADFLTKGGQNAVMVPVNNEELLAQAIIRVIEHPELADELSRKGPEIISELQEDKIHRMWIDAFNTLLNA